LISLALGKKLASQSGMHFDNDADRYAPPPHADVNKPTVGKDIVQADGIVTTT
jgi:hypothetical protein